MSVFLLHREQLIDVVNSAFCVHRFCAPLVSMYCC